MEPEYVPLASRDQPTHRRRRLLPHPLQPPARQPRRRNPRPPRRLERLRTDSLTVQHLAQSLPVPPTTDLSGRRRSFPAAAQRRVSRGASRLVTSAMASAEGLKYRRTFSPSCAGTWPSASARTRPARRGGSGRSAGTRAGPSRCLDRQRGVLVEQRAGLAVGETGQAGVRADVPGGEHLAGAGAAVGDEHRPAGAAPQQADPERSHAPEHGTATRRAKDAVRGRNGPRQQSRYATWIQTPVGPPHRSPMTQLPCLPR